MFQTDPALLPVRAGPVGVAFMLYDFAVGLEEEHHVTIPPYPWMRIRRLPGMPWGQDGLFEGVSAARRGRARRRPRGWEDTGPAWAQGVGQGG